MPGSVRLLLTSISPQRPNPYLKVVSKGPGAQHLEEGVVVHVLPHVVKIVVLASSTDALLGVGSAAQSGHGVRRVDGVKKYGLELQVEQKKNRLILWSLIESDTIL